MDRLRRQGAARAITAVETAAAFVDGFRDGPLDRAVRIVGFEQFERSLGGLHPGSEASYAVEQFFRNGGTEAWVVRTPGTDGSPPDAEALIGDPAAGTGLHALEGADSTCSASRARQKRRAPEPTLRRRRHAPR